MSENTSSQTDAEKPVLTSCVLSDDQKPGSFSFIISEEQKIRVFECFNRMFQTFEPSAQDNERPSTESVRRSVFVKETGENSWHLRYDHFDTGQFAEIDLSINLDARHYKLKLLTNMIADEEAATAETAPDALVETVITRIEGAVTDICTTAQARRKPASGPETPSLP